jgi:hypothetical protein
MASCQFNSDSSANRLAPALGRFLRRDQRAGNCPGPNAFSLREEIAMPVYHFEIVDGVRLDDPVGLDCQTEQDAKAKADLIARYIAIDLAELVHESRCVVVLDQDGTEIYKAAVKT